MAELLKDKNPLVLLGFLVTACEDGSPRNRGKGVRNEILLVADSCLNDRSHDKGEGGGL